MDIATLILSFASKYPIVMTIAVILGTLVVLGQAIVALTPSKSDDEAYSKIMDIPILGLILKSLSSFAVVQKK